LSLRNKRRRLCAFASWREIGFLIQAAVLAKAQRRKGRKGEHPVVAPLNSQRPFVCLTFRENSCAFREYFFTPLKTQTKWTSRFDTPVENHYGSPRPIFSQPPQREVSSTNKITWSQSSQEAVCGLFAANY
jgi:curved DNA-binding protein CbpA